MPTILRSGTLVHGRYRVEQLIEQDGMGAVYAAIDETFGSRVALKQMFPTPHPSLSHVVGLEQTFQHEASLLHQLRHPTLPHVSDYVVAAGECFLVMPAFTEATIPQRPHLPPTQPLPNKPASAPHRPRRLRPGSLVALVLVLILLGTGLSGCRMSVWVSGSERGDQTDALATPLATVIASTVSISPENAATVAQLGRLSTQSVYDVAWSPDSRQLAVASAIGLFLYDANTLKEIHPMAAKNSITRVAFAPDGATLASVSMYDTIGRLWNVADGKLLRTISGHTGGVWSVAFAPDGQTLASGSWDTTARLWRVANGTLLRTLEGHTGIVWSVAFAPDGATLASASSDGTVRLWQVADGTLLRTLEGHKDWVRSVVFAPDGAALASAAYDGTVQLWRVADGMLLHTLEGHTAMVWSVAFAPDGATLASGSADQTVRLWRVADGTLLHTLEGHVDEVRSVAFAPDGKTLASGSLDRTVRLWGIK